MNAIEGAASSVGAGIESGAAGIGPVGTPLGISSPSFASFPESSGIPNTIYTIGSVPAKVGGHFEFNASLMNGLERVATRADVLDAGKETKWTEAATTPVPRVFTEAFSEPAEPVGGSIIKDRVENMFSLNQPQVEIPALAQELVIPHQVHQGAKVRTQEEIVRIGQILRELEYATVETAPAVDAQVVLQEQVGSKTNVINFAQARQALRQRQRVPEKRKTVVTGVQEEVAGKSVQSQKTAIRTLRFIRHEEAMVARKKDTFRRIDSIPKDRKIEPEELAPVVGSSIDHISELVLENGESEDGSIRYTQETILDFKEFKDKWDAKRKVEAAIDANKAVKIDQDGTPVEYFDVEKVLEGKEAWVPENRIVRLVQKEIDQVEEFEDGSFPEATGAGEAKGISGESKTNVAVRINNDRIELLRVTKKIEEVAQIQEAAPTIGDEKPQSLEEVLEKLEGKLKADLVALPQSRKALELAA